MNLFGDIMPQLIINVIAGLLIFNVFNHLPSVSSSECSSNRLVLYKVIFRTNWNRKLFPRQYPEWRPPAQWSKVVGFSHSPDYKLFRIGDVASAAVQEFAETGSTSSLDILPTDSSATNATNTTVSEFDKDSILDGFTAPPIQSGVGMAQSNIFLDGNHSMVSLMSKLVPSPDWFVGLDSLDLCKNGRFVDSVKIEADPIDAGTDNGFTFTSPNWPTVPKAAIFRITNVYPSHPAGSFWYPEKDMLPSIATFTFLKEKEYELSEVFDNQIEDSDDEESENEIILSNSDTRYMYNIDENNEQETSNNELDISEKPDHNEMGNEIIAFVPAKEDHKESSKGTDLEKEEVNNEISTISNESNDIIIDNEIPLKKGTKKEKLGKKHHKKRKISKSSLNSDHPTSIGIRSKPMSARKRFQRGRGFRNTKGYHASSGPLDFIKKRYKSEYLEAAQEKVLSDDEYYQNILDKYQKYRKSGLSTSLAKRLQKRKLRKARHHRKRHNSTRYKGPKHCRVGEWGPWSKCSKSCGIGEQTRSRKIIRHPKRGGKSCPELETVRWCGSARNECRGKYFDW